MHVFDVGATSLTLGKVAARLVSCFVQEDRSFLWQILFNKTESSTWQVECLLGYYVFLCHQDRSVGVDAKLIKETAR